MESVGRLNDRVKLIQRRLIEDNTALTATYLSRISLQIPVEAGQRYEIAVDAKLLAE